MQSTRAEPDKPDSPKGDVAGFKFDIEVVEGKCVFNYEGPSAGQLKTDVLAPCEFVRDEKDAVRYYKYPNPKKNGGGYYHVILLIGGPTSTDGYSDKYMKNGCGTEALPITLSPRGVALGHLATEYPTVVCYCEADLRFPATRYW